MLTLEIAGEEYFNEELSEFELRDGFTLELEHSLVSLSKWESKFNKPFLGETERTLEELLYYIECMILTPNFPPEVLSRFSVDNFKVINEYIESKQTATTFSERPQRKGRGETVTSELIYYWMVAFNIPFECETWHLNRLFALIRICNIKNSPPKKMSKGEIARRNRELNDQRRAALGTTG